jgi:hypothetical protein
MSGKVRITETHAIRRLPRNKFSFALWRNLYRNSNQQCRFYAIALVTYPALSTANTLTHSIGTHPSERGALPLAGLRLPSQHVEPCVVYCTVYKRIAPKMVWMLFSRRCFFSGWKDFFSTSRNGQNSNWYRDRGAGLLVHPGTTAGTVQIHIRPITSLWYKLTIAQ